MAHPNPITPELIDVAEEYMKAKRKHGEFTLDGKMAGGSMFSATNDLFRLAALMEEVGEVAQLFTYDKIRISKVNLRKELIQVANIALTWASILRQPAERPLIFEREVRGDHYREDLMKGGSETT